MANDERTRNYIARRSSEGKTMGEIARMLKRYIARGVQDTAHHDLTSHLDGRSLGSFEPAHTIRLCNK